MNNISSFFYYEGDYSGNLPQPFSLCIAAALTYGLVYETPRHPPLTRRDACFSNKMFMLSSSSVQDQTDRLRKLIQIIPTLFAPLTELDFFHWLCMHTGKIVSCMPIATIPPSPCILWPAAARDCAVRTLYIQSKKW